MTENLHLWVIPILPLIGAAINGFLGRRFARQTVVTVALAASGAAFAMVLWVASQFSSASAPMSRTWLRGFAPEISKSISRFILISFRL